MAEIVLTTERLELRRITPHDAQLQFNHLNSAESMRYIGGPMDLPSIQQRHAKMDALFEQRGFGFLMLYEKASDEQVGHTGIKVVDNALAPNPGDHEIGWNIRPDRWRRGYAYEVVSAVIDWAFGPVQAEHVVALTSGSNIASWRLMEKLGMERRQDLDFADPAFPLEDNPTIQYSLTKAQWGTHQ